MAQIAQYLGTGKRKTSVARVILRPGDGATWINGRTLEEYFPRATHREAVRAAARRERRRDLRPPRARARRRHLRPGRRDTPRHCPRARRSRSRAARAAEARGFLTRDARVVERKKAGLHKARKAPPVLEALVGARLASPDLDLDRRYFGTDGVRGVVGEALTPDLVERLGKAATLWSGRGRVLVGRDTRGTGPELEAALTRGIVSAAHARGRAAHAGGGTDGADLGAVVTASHNPPEYNGVKFFDREGKKLTDEGEAEVEALLDAAGVGGGSVEEAGDAAAGYVDHLVANFGSDLTGLRVAVDCANGAFSAIAPGVFERLGASVTAVAVDPDGMNINVGCGATDLTLLADVVRAGEYDLGVAFDGDGDQFLAVDETGAPLDGDQIVAVIALARGVDTVAVTGCRTWASTG